MKKILFLLAICVFFFPLCACEKKTSKTIPTTVITTTEKQTTKEVNPIENFHRANWDYTEIQKDFVMITWYVFVRTETGKIIWILKDELGKTFQGEGIHLTNSNYLYVDNTTMQLELTKEAYDYVLTIMN